MGRKIGVRVVDGARVPRKALVNSPRDRRREANLLKNESLQLEREREKDVKADSLPDKIDTE